MVANRTAFHPLASAAEALAHAGRVAALDDIRRARGCFADLTSGLDQRRALTLRAELNDAYLRMQFAVVAGQADRLRSEAAALTRLVREAREAGGGNLSGEGGPA